MLMKQGLLIFFTLFYYGAFSQLNNYEKAWHALNENKWSEAVTLLRQARQDPANFMDAYITSVYVETYKGKEKEIKDFSSMFYAKAQNPYPYIYALWFNQAVAGMYGKKQFDHQLKLLNQLIHDDKAIGTLVAAANYQMGMHHLYSNDFDKSNKYCAAIGNIRNWQYTGPFENLSQSGYYKSYGPLEHPEPGASFKSITDADVKWFVPAEEINDGWNPVIYQFNNYTAVVYAQNFVNSPADQEVYCNVGASGSLKVWINDEMIIAEPKERLTEMDTYIVPCKLKKGTNRVLVQLGFTNNSFPNFTVRFTNEKFHPVPGITGSAAYATYAKAGSGNEALRLLTPFAENYFTNKISEAPGNLLNYLLLADVFLRNKKVIEARNILTEAIRKAPDNCLLKMKMAEVLIQEGNRTLLLEEIEKIKQLDPESLLVMQLNIKEYYDNQKYEDAARELERRVKLYGEDESTADYKLLLLVQDKNYEELLKEVERFYDKYPANEQVIQMMYTVKKEVYKDKKAAMKVYETYMKDNFNYDAFSKYA